MSLYYLILSTIIPLTILLSSLINLTYAQVNDRTQNSTTFQHPFPRINDPHLRVELVVDALFTPTGMLFLDKDNILVLQRYTTGFPLGGLTSVNLVSNGSISSEPVLTIPSGLCDIHNRQPECNRFNERGLLGIAARKINSTNPTLADNLEVFLYYTEITITGQVLGNRVYKYLWNGDQLINPSLILDLPASPGPNHNGGKVLIGPDGYLYTIIGDQGNHSGQLQNVVDGPSPDNTSVILRVDPEVGLGAPDNPFIVRNGNSSPINTGGYNTSNAKITEMNSDSLRRYYAYGIRNSFGLAFDPVTGNLWDTENGVYSYDEINLVKPGFNSGWSRIMGPIDRNNKTTSDLVNFPGSKYSDPEFSWKTAIAVTAMGFLNSSKLGMKYKNNLFVGDANTGSLYFFKLNENRDGIAFERDQNELSDLVADNGKERSKVVLGTGFDIITDIKTGPDGYLYILSYSEYYPHNISRIYRILPKD